MSRHSSISSARTRLSHSSPNVSNPLSTAPSPTESVTRPSEIRSTVATWLASSHGRRREGGAASFRAGSVMFVPRPGRARSRRRHPRPAPRRTARPTPRPRRRREIGDVGCVAPRHYETEPHGQTLDQWKRPRGLNGHTLGADRSTAFWHTPWMSDEHIVPDDKDWTWVLERACPECGFDASGFDVRDVGGLIRDNTGSWLTTLDAPAGNAAGPATPRPLVDARVRRPRARRPPAVSRTADDDARRGRPVVSELGSGRDRGRQRVQRAGPRGRRRSSTPRPRHWPTRSTRSVRTIGSGAGGAATAPRSPSRAFARYLIHDPVHHLWDVRTPPR